MGTIGLAIQAAEPTCPDNQDGQVSVQPTNGLAPYRWLWATGDTVATLTGLGAGMYSGNIQDALNCAISFNIPIQAPDTLRANPTVTNATGPITANGAIDITPTGGTGSIAALWSNGQNTLNINNLLPGTYTVTLTDANGCQRTETIIVDWTNDTEEPTDEEEVVVFPVPARDRIEWRGLPDGSPVQARLYTPTGALVRTVTGEGLRSLSLEGLPASGYFLEVNGRMFWIVKGQ
jgi:hypothetical protein